MCPASVAATLSYSDVAGNAIRRTYIDAGYIELVISLSLPWKTVRGFLTIVVQG